MLIEGLPDAGPHTRHLTDGREWGAIHDMLWAIMWEQMRGSVIAARAAGDKKAELPSENRPRFPWSDTDNKSKFGDMGDADPEMVAAFLDSL